MPPGNRADACWSAPSPSGSTFAFETTLGGKTITALLERALGAGGEVRIWYVGLSTPELHLARVRARVARGGHDIPEAQIRARYDASRLNLIRMLPHLTELRVYDNSVEAVPQHGRDAGAQAAAAHGPRSDRVVRSPGRDPGVGEADPGRCPAERGGQDTLESTRASTVARARRGSATASLPRQPT